MRLSYNNKVEMEICRETPQCLLKNCLGGDFLIGEKKKKIPR
jgi:hypothetical protein